MFSAATRGTASLSARRAWIEIEKSTPEEAKRWSLSARRAWIEISGGASARLLALSSLSARRAWIEIAGFIGGSKAIIVALRKESVDRNYIIKITVTAPRRRSPQGERG